MQSTGFQAQSLDVGGTALPHDSVKAWPTEAETTLEDATMLAVAQDTSTLPGDSSFRPPSAPVVSGYDALRYCTLREEMHQRPYSIVGLPLPACVIPAARGMHNMSPDLLGDINCALAIFRRSTPERAFGAIWQLPELVYERDRVRFHLTLYTRAAIFGFGMRTKKIIFKERNDFGEPFEVDRFFISFTRPGESTPRQSDASTGLARHEVDEWCRKTGHPWMDQHVEEATTTLRPLRFRKWHLLALDRKVQIGLSAELCEDGTGVPALQELVDLVLAVASAGGAIAFDLENTSEQLPADAALATLGVFVGGVFTVVIETHPWALLRAVCRQRCTLLVFSPSEIEWFAAREIELRARVFDVQGDTFYRRDDDCRDRGARGRKLPEAFALIRGCADPLYFKGVDTSAFFFPEGYPNRWRSIWSYRPLETNHVNYAAADVVALLLMHPHCLAAAPNLARAAPLPMSAPTLRPESPPPGSEGAVLNGLLATLRQAKRGHDEHHHTTTASTEWPPRLEIRKPGVEPHRAEMPSQPVTDELRKSSSKTASAGASAAFGSTAFTSTSAAFSDFEEYHGRDDTGCLVKRQKKVSYTLWLQPFGSNSRFMLEMHDSWTIEVFISQATATVLLRDATFKVGKFILGGRVIDEIDKSLFFLTAFPNVTNEAIITVMRATPLVVGAFKEEEEEEEEDRV